MNVNEKVEKYWDVGKFVNELGILDESPDETLTLIETDQGKFLFVYADYVDTNPEYYNPSLKQRGLAFSRFVKLRSEFVPKDPIVHPAVDYYSPDDLEKTREHTLTSPDSYMRGALIECKELGEG